MKKLVSNIFRFFKKEHMPKYIVLASTFIAGIIVFLFLSKQDVTGTIVGSVVGFIFSTLMISLIKIITGRFEDSLKVNCDTDSILKVYSEELYKKTLTLNNTNIYFAYNDCFINDGTYKFEVIDHPNNYFQLDDFIQGNFESIFKSHLGSYKENTLTIRLDSFVKDDVNKKITFNLSRSNFYNHLVTNRAIDVMLFNSISLRNMYECGPVLSPLENSKMSNHIGINALVFLNDGNILVPRRKGNSTISKNKVTSSIAIKLNLPNKLKPNDYINTDYVIRDNLFDNLQERLDLDESAIKIAKPNLFFLGFGRNVYEAGKPQFYYVIKLDIDTKTYQSLAIHNSKEKKIDVDKLIYIADYSSFKFDKGLLKFNIYNNKEKIKKVSVKYEMSYLCNIWHYEKYKNK